MEEADRKPYLEEARRRVREFRTTVARNHCLLDEEVAQLMADYAAVTAEESYERGLGWAETVFNDNG